MMTKNKVCIENEKEMSKMSRYFLFLLKIGLIPLKMDLTTKKLTFKMWSRPTACYLLYYFISGFLLDFSSLYIWGYQNWITFFINMYKINVTDFLTYISLIVFNIASYFQFRVFNDITKISSELTLSKTLAWPKHGTTFLCTSILCTIFQIMWAVFLINSLIEISQSSLIWITVAFSLNFVLFSTVLFNLLLFYLIWMEQFSKICGEDVFDPIQHSQRCLTIFQSIQDGLSVGFCRYFFSFQIMIVISLYMGISTIYFAPYNLITNIIASIFYGLLFLYSGFILYVLTVAGENAHNSLQKMTKPLNIMAKMEKDEERRTNAQLLLDEIKNTPPLNGNGYFELKKDTLTSITSTTITYLIILLQFRSS